MKVELFLVRHGEYEGLYTKSELEELKQEIIEDYRNDKIGYLEDIFNAADYKTLTLAALGDENGKKKIQEYIENCEEQYWDDFYTEYVDEYEKEI